MVLQSANCTECRSEVWHNDNFCQECGSRTSFVSKLDTEWRETPAAPSWNSEYIERTWQKPSEPTWTKFHESSWNQTNEPTPIRSFVQSALAPQPVPSSEPTSMKAPPPPSAPLPAVAVVPVQASVSVPVQAPVPAPVVENKQQEIVVPEVAIPEVVVKPTSKPEFVAVEQPPAPEPKEVEEKREDVVLKSRWSALESPLLRPRMSDEVVGNSPVEKVSNKGKITSILWLCVCFLAGILIYCLFDIVKMTVLKPASVPVKQHQSAVAPASPEKKVELPVKSTVPVNSISVGSPVTAKPAVVTPKPALKPTLVPTKAQAAVVKPLSKPVVPVKLPVIAKPRLSHPVAAPEVVKPRTSAESENTSRTRTVWEAPANVVKTQQMPVTAVVPVTKTNRVVSTSKGSGGDLARYNRLLADYFSRAGNGSFGDESSEPPTYSEWLSRGKPEF